ncbi:hypothetical protein ACN28S_25720 [Cystobacter fuscus]
MSGTRVRWLVAGAFHPSPTGRRFPLTEQSFAEQLRLATTGLRVTVPDRIGSGDTSTHTLSFGSLDAFGMSALIASLPELRALGALREAISGTRPLAPEHAAQLRASLGEGRLTEALARARSSRADSLALVEQALFTTARELLQHPLVARLESAWRGLHWLWTHCPASVGMELEVLDVGPEALVDTLAASLEGPALQRPDACFLLDVGEDPATPGRLAALGEQAGCRSSWRPPHPWAEPRSRAPRTSVPRRRGTGCAPTSPRAGCAPRSTRWWCAPSNMERCAANASPVPCWAWRRCWRRASATHTFARLVGPGSPVRAPAVWRPQEGRGPVATEACLSLREQQRLASRGRRG